MTEIDLNPDAAHTPERTAHTADVRAQCLRVLSYATEPGRGGLIHPADAYQLAGEVRTGGYRLTEVLERTSAWLQAEHEAGHFMLDAMGPHSLTSSKLKKRMIMTENDVTREDLAVQLAGGRQWAVNGTEWADLDDATRVAATAEADAWLEATDAAGLTVLSLNPDRPHSTARTEHTAYVIERSMRVLSYAAEKVGGLDSPGDVYGLLGTLRLAASLESEVLDRLAQFLARELDAGRLRHDQDQDVAVAIAAATDRLNDARAAATGLGEALSKAQSALSRVGGTEAKA